MARLTQLPEEHIISGLKGSIDFYQWKDVKVARKWPRKYTPPFSPQMAASQLLYKDLTQSWKDLAPILQTAARHMAQSTSQRNLDAFISYQYGYLINEDNGFKVAPSLEASLLYLPVGYAPANNFVTININSLTYIRPGPTEFVIPWDIVSFNRYRLLTRSNANQVGETIDLQIQELVSSNPLGDGSVDLQVPSTSGVHTGADKVISTIPVTPLTYALALKGSNATVDLAMNWVVLLIWQDLS